MKHPAYKITGVVQNYAWGGSGFLPALLNDLSAQIPGLAPQASNCFAEYWLGTHPAGTATVELSHNQYQPLPDFLQEHSLPPLPFLFKVLDVQSMLSIQVHPNRQQAAAGFARENAAGLPADAKNRNYKDDNHKPEMMLALSPFWLLHGIAPESEIIERLQAHAFLAPLAETLKSQGIKPAVRLSLNQNDNRTLKMQKQLGEWLLSQPPLTDKYQVEFWIQRWLQQNPKTPTGILTVLFMNVMALQPGEACYQPSGLLHAYLEGQNIELMANSDNVLRAGLTPKHIDVEELFNIGEFNSTSPTDFKITPADRQNAERVFPTPFTEFEISEILNSTDINPEGCEMLFCLSGSTNLQADTAAMALTAGEAALLSPGSRLKLSPQPASRCFRIKTPTN